MQWYDYALIPLTYALTELIKTTTMCNTRWVPLVSLSVGIVLAMLLAAATPEPNSAFWIRTFFQGLVIGLSASGLYSGAKAVSGAAQRERDTISDLEEQVTVLHTRLNDALRRTVNA